MVVESCCITKVDLNLARMVLPAFKCVALLLMLQLHVSVSMPPQMYAPQQPHNSPQYAPEPPHHPPQYSYQQADHYVPHPPPPPPPVVHCPPPPPPCPHSKPYPVPIPIPIIQPPQIIRIPVDRPVTITKHVPFAVEKPFPVDRPIPIDRPVAVPIPVPYSKPVPFPVPVFDHHEEHNTAGHGQKPEHPNHYSPNGDDSSYAPDQYKNNANFGNSLYDSDRTNPGQYGHSDGIDSNDPQFGMANDAFSQGFSNDQSYAMNSNPAHPKGSQQAPSSSYYSDFMPNDANLPQMNNDISKNPWNLHGMTGNQLSAMPSMNASPFGSFQMPMNGNN